MDGTRSLIERSFVLLNIFDKLSGLKVNYEKTEALWIGSFKNRLDKLAINQNIRWSIRKVKSLGVWFSSSKEEAVVLNYQEKKEKISKILSCWLLRRLTLLGKVTVIKSLAASQLVYIMSVVYVQHFTPRYCRVSVESGRGKSLICITVE